MEQRAAQAVDITSKILRQFIKFLWSDIIGRPPYFIRRRGGVTRHHSQAKVDDFHRAAICKEDIRRLNVAVNETDFHGSFEALCHLNPSFERRGFRNHSPFLHEIVERPAGDQFHSDEKLRPTFSEIKNPNNIGMVDPCCCAGLMRELFRLRLHVARLNF